MNPRDKFKDAPLFMMAQLPFNNTHAVELNSPMTEVMDDSGNTAVLKQNLEELGVWSDILSPNSESLEVGCGRGYMLEALYKEGKGAYYGLEPIPHEAKTAREKLSALNITEDRVSTELMENCSFGNTRFDFIYSYHVFEHLENPLDMIHFADKWLKDTGKLIIICPNVEGEIPQRDLEAWRCSLPSHRWLPGLSTTRRALEHSNFEIVRHFTYGGHCAPRTAEQDRENAEFKARDKGDVMCLLTQRKNL